MRKILLSILVSVLFVPCLHFSAFALKPSKVYLAVPDTMQLPYEKNTITASDNVKLKSWTFLPAKDANNSITLVLAYADAGNMSWWLNYGAVLSQMGYTVVLFDYRGFGESDDFAIDPKMLYYNEFAKDLEAVVKFAKGKYTGNKTGIWCFSMGTIITTLAAKTIKPDFIIGDSYVTDPAGIKKYYAPQKKEIDLPADANKYEAVLAGINVPMLVFSGDEDEVTTQASIKKLQEKKPSLKMISYKGGHMAGFGVLTDPKKFPGSEYVAAINDFLKVE